MDRASYLHPESLRARAERCRTLAETFRDEWVKTKMLNLADSYDRMADASESFEKETSLLHSDMSSGYRQKSGTSVVLQGNVMSSRPPRRT